VGPAVAGAYRRIRADGGLLRGDSASDFFGWQCGERVKWALRWEQGEY